MAAVNISIEVLVLFSLFTIFLIWILWYNITRWIANKRYNPNNDKGRKGEERRTELVERGNADPGREITESISGSGRSTQPEEPGVSMATTPESPGETDKSVRRIDKLREFFNKTSGK